MLCGGTIETGPDITTGGDEDADDDDEEPDDGGALYPPVPRGPVTVDEFEFVPAPPFAIMNSRFSLFFAFNSLATLAFCFLDIRPNFTA